MRVDLVALLSRREIKHPTRIERAVMTAGGLDVVARGTPWWRGAYAGAPEEQITLVFEHPYAGVLPIRLDDDGDEDLEGLRITPLDEVDWAQPECCWMYCNGPIPDPVTLYAKLQDFLVSAGAFKAPGDFLNQGQSLSGFLSLAAKRSYLVARGPDVICRLLRDELDRQNVSHTVMSGDAPRATGLWVRLNGASFFCTAAWAEFAE